MNNTKRTLVETVAVNIEALSENDQSYVLGIMQGILLARGKEAIGEKVF